MLLLISAVKSTTHHLDIRKLVGPPDEIFKKLFLYNNGQRTMAIFRSLFQMPPFLFLIPYIFILAILAYSEEHKEEMESTHHHINNG